MSESDTTIRVYSADRDWLQQRQRRMSLETPRTPTMADVVRELRLFVEAQESTS